MLIGYGQSRAHAREDRYFSGERMSKVSICPLKRMAFGQLDGLDIVLRSTEFLEQLVFPTANLFQLTPLGETLEALRHRVVFQMCCFANLGGSS